MSSAAPPASHADSRKVVLAALAGNVAIAACKFAAAFLSHSTATLAEAVHSLADTGNQGLLLVGMTLAARPASARFPFGRASERYFWPFVVAVMLLSVGGAFAIFEGFDHLLHPAPQEHAFKWSYGVLGVSLAMEAMSFRVAMQEFRKLAGGLPIQRALLEARDPTIPLVLAEDATAITGLVVALLAVTANALTGQDFWDPLGSIVIGALLCAVALVLAKVTHGLLIGESATPENQARALELASSVGGVERVTQLLTMHLGPDVVLLAMKIAFVPTLRVAEVEDVTNRIEAKIRAELPQMRKIFIEADSAGDLRGITPDADHAGRRDGAGTPGTA
jgi:cation diffusion facilitator family transporter